MNCKYLTGTLATGLLLTATQGVWAGDFVHKSISCPRNNALVVGTLDANINIEDVIVSSDAPTDVTLKYVGEQGNRVFMRVYLPGNDTVVSNFSQQLNGEKDAAVRMSCKGQAQVDISVIGSGRLE
jgi:hypothetical protein